ncbi:MAG TPA: creatininase family protein [Thermomicrobiales bacterium]
MPFYLLHEITRTAARELAADAVALLPTGATEQHGPHLPVGTDTFAVECIAREAARRAGERIPVVVTPTLPFGSSHHHLPFGGTMSFSTETYYRVIRDLAESLIQSGFRRIFIINGHGGNDELIQLVARDLALERPVSLAAASYWRIASEALTRLDAHLYGRFPGHAGAFETSLVLALRPELASNPLPHRDDSSVTLAPATTYRLERYGAWQNIEGFTDSPDLADRARGQAYLTAIADAVGQALIEFYEQTGGEAR